MHLFPRGHPSARHSTFDWSNATEVPLSFILYHLLRVVTSMYVFVCMQVALRPDFRSARATEVQ